MAVKIFFKSEGHKERLLTTIQRIGKVWKEENNRVDPEYGAALYILTADPGTWNQSEDYVSRDGIDFETMLAEIDFSSGYHVLIDLAWNLFNGHVKVDVLDLLRLDEGNFHVAMTAIELRRTGPRLAELAAWPE